MSDEAKQFHEEDAMSKAYDWGVARRLFRYLKPYKGLVIIALFLTLITNILGPLQPKFTQYGIDNFIVKGQLSGFEIFVLAFFAVMFLQYFFAYIQEILINNVGQRVMFDLR